MEISCVKISVSLWQGLAAADDFGPDDVVLTVPDRMFGTVVKDGEVIVDGMQTFKQLRYFFYNLDVMGVGEKGYNEWLDDVIGGSKRLGINQPVR